MKPMQRIGQNIKSQRIRCGMTQKQVADDIETSRVALAYWERGSSEIRATKLHALACCFGVPMERFFEGVEWGDD